jgi:riboflavin-specific deaminase-like protein
VIYPTRNHPEDLLLGSISTSHPIAALLENLAEVRDRARPRGRPFVTLAYAQSLDGSITIARGQRYALSGPDAMRFTHTLRARHDAILVGVGTVLADDPQLGVRLVDGPSPQPVVVDSRLRTPVTAKLLAQPAGRPVWIAAAADAGRRDGGDDVQRRERLARLGRIVDCPALPNGWVDLGALLARLGADGVRHVMVEGGARIITSLLEARLADYVVVTIAPQFLGGLAAIGPSARTGVSSAVANLKTWVGGRLGDDLVLAGEVAWPTG